MGSLVGGECAATSRSLKRIVKSQDIGFQAGMVRRQTGKQRVLASRQGSFEPTSEPSPTDGGRPAPQKTGLRCWRDSVLDYRLPEFLDHRPVLHKYDGPAKLLGFCFASCRPVWRPSSFTQYINGRTASREVTSRPLLGGSAIVNANGAKCRPGGFNGPRTSLSSNYSRPHQNTQELAAEGNSPRREPLSGVERNKWLKAIARDVRRLRLPGGSFFWQPNLKARLS